MDTDKVGKFIANRRKICGLTQQELADELGITNKAVSKWETGQGMPDITALPMLADILGVSVDELLDGQSSARQNDNSGENSDVKKVIYWFRTAAVLSIFFAVLGVAVPFFMLKEASVTGSLLFGCWWEVISAALFFTFYLRMKNVVVNDNKRTLLKPNPHIIRNQFMKYEMWLWLIIPSFLIAHLLLLIFSYNNLIVTAAIAFILTLTAGMLVWIRMIYRKKA